MDLAVILRDIPKLRIAAVRLGLSSLSSVCSSCMRAGLDMIPLHVFFDCMDGWLQDWRTKVRSDTPQTARVIHVYSFDTG